MLAKKVPSKILIHSISFSHEGVDHFIAKSGNLIIKGEKNTESCDNNFHGMAI
jgi:hypothetical protein